MDRFFSVVPVRLSKGIALVRFITGSFLLFHNRECFDALSLDGLYFETPKHLY